MDDFRNRYRKNDLILVDDVQFLIGKERTQEEFFHTFNALHENHKQIVLTADRKPHEISDIADRLRTRFAWGLMADIEPPELEVRVAILRKKAEDDDIELDDDVLDYIARNCRSNVRELEGAVIKLLAYSSLTRREVALDLAKEALGGVLRPGPAPVVTADLIREQVAAEWGVSVEGLMSKRRTKELTVPRQVAMYLIRDLLDLSLVEIGNLFGGRDHSTVIHAVNKIEEDIATDDAFRARVALLRAQFEA
jgi:chromosomal replication initiator protein